MIRGTLKWTRSLRISIRESRQTLASPPRRRPRYDNCPLRSAVMSEGPLWRTHCVPLAGRRPSPVHPHTGSVRRLQNNNNVQLRAHGRAVIALTRRSTIRRCGIVRHMQPRLSGPPRSRHGAPSNEPCTPTWATLIMLRRTFLTLIHHLRRPVAQFPTSSGPL